MCSDFNAPDNSFQKYSSRLCHKSILSWQCEIHWKLVMSTWEALWNPQFYSISSPSSSSISLFLLLIARKFWSICKLDSPQVPYVTVSTPTSISRACLNCLLRSFPSKLENKFRGSHWIDPLMYPHTHVHTFEKMRNVYPFFLHLKLCLCSYCSAEQRWMDVSAVHTNPHVQ